MNNKLRATIQKVNDDFVDWTKKIDIEKIKNGSNKTGKLYGLNKITHKILKSEHLSEVEKELINKEFKFNLGDIDG